jgi:hypothetical protein
MTSVIHKVVLENPIQRAILPKDFGVVHVHEQHGKPTIWYKFEEKNRLTVVERIFRVYATGFSVPLEDFYIGTVHISGFVFHVFMDRIK